MPERINKAIELLEQGQPIYYTGAPDLSYEGGKAMAKTWADYINVSLEHRAFDLQALDDLCAVVARAGADAVAISPLHALFASHPERFSPYSPSSRLFYNVWHASPECVFDAETLARAQAPFSEAMAQQASLEFEDGRLFLEVHRSNIAGIGGLRQSQTLCGSADWLCRNVSSLCDLRQRGAGGTRLKRER